MKKALRVIMIACILCAAFALSGFALSGISVQYDGQTVVLEDAAQNINGRVMVPFRGFLENALGADVSFDEGSGTISASCGDITVSFKAGQAEASVTKDGKTEIVAMDPAPFIDPDSGRTYVGARFFGEVFGLGVGWDASCNTVVIINTERLFDIDSDFTVVNGAMKAQQEYYNTPYQMTGKMNMAMASTQEAFPLDMTFDIDYDALYNNGDIDMKMNMKPDFSKLIAAAGEDMDEASALILSNLKNIDFTMKMDMDTGDVYYQSSIFNLYPIPLGEGSTITGDSWLKLNLFQMPGTTGITPALNYSEIMLLAKENPTFSGTLKTLFGSVGYTADSYSEISTAIALLKEVIGDSAFTVTQQSGSDGMIKVYTRSFEKSDLEGIVEKFAKDLPQEDAQELSDMMSSFSGKFTYTFKADVYQYSTYSFEMTLTDSASGQAISMEANGVNSLKGITKADITMDIAGLLSMDITTEATIDKINDAAEIEMPAENVIDLTSLLQLN